MDVNRYRVETNSIDGKWVELEDVLEIAIDQSLVRTPYDGIVSRTVDEVLVDCIIDGKVTLLWGSAEQFKFTRR